MNVLDVSSPCVNELKRCQALIQNKNKGFEHLYIELNFFFSLLEKSPDSIDEPAVDSLFTVIESDRHIRQKQAYFLFQKAAELLIFAVLNGPQAQVKNIITRLQKNVIYSKGRKQRALSEVLGSLPLKIKGPKLEYFSKADIVKIDFKSLCNHLSIPVFNHFKWQGRTLIIDKTTSKIVCMKFARNKEDVKNLAVEISWLKYLKQMSAQIVESFHIPQTLILNGKGIFKIVTEPDGPISENMINLSHYAIVFEADKAYYNYANEWGPEINNHDAIIRMFKFNARLCGALAAKGIIHTALIPLFHNRVQQSRRNDRGRYLWEHGGRLDQWLASCRYPNVADSGIRDFEHFLSIKDSKSARHYIGEHLLALILLIGSLFRNRAPKLKGWDDDGQPRNLCYLFEKNLFAVLIKEVIISYCQAFTGRQSFLPASVCDLNFIEKLILVMGIDHDMEESLRVQDQNRMNKDEFFDFLLSRGLDPVDCKNLVKGEKDISFFSGPHLGGFNQQISIPELIEILFSISSICISDRYLNENRLKGQGI